MSPVLSIPPDRPAVLDQSWRPQSQPTIAQSRDRSQRSQTTAIIQRRSICHTHETFVNDTAITGGAERIVASWGLRFTLSGIWDDTVLDALGMDIVWYTSGAMIRYVPRLYVN